MICAVQHRYTVANYISTWDECFDVVKRATEAVLPFGSRVSLVLKADIRPGYEGQIDSKIERLKTAIEKQDDQAHS